MFAGGDPWKVNAMLQSGRPAQISHLAQAFHDAGRSTLEAEEAFRQAKAKFEQSWTHENGENPINDSAEVQKATKLLGTQGTQLPQIGADLQAIAAALADAQRRAGTEIAGLESQLLSLDEQIGEAVDLENTHPLTASERQLVDHHIDELEKHAIDATKASLSKLEGIRDNYARQLRTSTAILRTHDGYSPPLIEGVSGQVPETPEQQKQDDQRLQNQTRAFHQVFGRDPESTSDWDTAAALDPQTYDPKFKGVNSNVEVVRIRPVPGQGVVRVSQWIEQYDVTSAPPWKRDMGNNRVANTNFDPEDTKVTTYIDYENGIVVLRQNPSVEETTTGGPGEVRIGTPRGSVSQLSDGSVRVKYDAGNPFAPGVTTNPKGPMENHTITVNGDLVFTPGPTGVQINGTRTDYPSLEAYQDLPGGGTKTLMIDPAQSGRSGGPALNLEGHHDVGPLGGKAFAPFDKGDWNPQYDVFVPLPSTDFGPVTAIPSVPPLPAGGAVLA